VQSSRSCAAFAQVADALLVEDRFQFAAKLSAGERFCEEKALQISVFKLFTDGDESLLAVDQAFKRSMDGGFGLL